MESKRDAVVGAVCLVGASVGQLAQYVVTPIGSENAGTTEQVQLAAEHLTALRVASWLDLTILLFVPALLYVGRLAGARTTWLGWIATLVAFGTTLPGVAYLLAVDPLLLAATSTGSPATLQAYLDQPVVSLSTVVFLLGHLVGLVLLAVALWRTRAVPRWAAVALALSPVAEFAGQGAGVRGVAVTGYLLLIVAFVTCAAVLLRRTEEPAPSPSDAFVPSGA